MNAIDIGILIIFGISCLAGLLRGFTRETLSLFTWAGSAFATYITVPLCSGITRGYIANPMIADAVTAAILFIIFLILFSLISGAIADSVRKSSLGGIDRGLGVMFGIIRAVIMICSIEILFSTFTLRPHQSATIQQARFTPMIRRGADSLTTWLPHSAQTFILTQQAEAHAKAGTASAGSSTPPSPSPLTVDSILNEAVQSVVGEGKNGPVSPSAPFKKIIVPAPKTEPAAPPPPSLPKAEDPEKTAENLAQLTPQTMTTKNQDGDYNKRQQRELDRLIQINQ